MPSKVICYFQETEPNSSAVAIRGKYFTESIQKNLSSKIKKIQIITATEDNDANESVDVEYIRFSVGKTDEGVPPLRRILAEILFGAKSLLWFFFNYRDSILIISSPNYLPSLILAASAKLLKVKYILDIRDAYPEAYAQSGLISTSSMVYKLFHMASSFMYNNASAISVATDGLRKIIPIPVCEITTIYNGFPSALISSTAEKHENFTVCFHGVMGYFQDIDKLIELIEHPDLSEVNFKIIGYGRKSDLFRSLKSENCQFLGRLSYSETIQQVSMCHLGISIRLNNAISHDSFPVKVWEYIGLGIPSLVYPESEAGEFLLSKNCGVQLPSKDVDEIARILLNIKFNSPLYEGMRDSCRVIRESYTRENMSCNFSKIVEKVLKDSEK